MSHAYLPVPTNDTETYTFDGIDGDIELPLLTIVIGVFSFSISFSHH